MTLKKPLDNFMSINQKLAKKYQCQVSIGVPGQKPIILADGRPQKKLKSCKKKKRG